MKYDVKYFIKKFEAIPEDKWTQNSYVLGSKMCALGHCGTFSMDWTEEATALNYLFADTFLNVPNINDENGYNGVTHTLISENELLPVKQLGDTPKERILNALYIIDNKLLEDL